MKCVSRQIGDFEVIALSDGNMSASLDLLSGITTTDAGEIQRSAGVTDPGNLHIYGYLIRGRGRTILVDSGTGGANNVGGQLAGHLQDFGVVPQAVDTLLLTHAHPDHIGGLLNEAGDAVYPNAQLYLHPNEVAFWQDDERLAQANERAQRNFTRARRTLAVYGERVHLLDDKPIVEGIRPVALPGHTPGHTGYRIDSPQESLIIWGTSYISPIFRPRSRMCLLRLISILSRRRHHVNGFWLRRCRKSCWWRECTLGGVVLRRSSLRGQDTVSSI